MSRFNQDISLIKRQALPGEYIQITCASYSFDKIGNIYPVHATPLVFDNIYNTIVLSSDLPLTHEYSWVDWPFNTENYVVVEGYNPNN